MADNMSIDFLNDDEGAPNDELGMTVEKDTNIKEWLVNYVGDKVTPNNSEVTLAMVLDTVSDEFPEFVLPIAEENFIRGYKQALADVEMGERLLRESGQEATEATDTNV